MKDIIVIGSSAGGVEALRRLCTLLPADFPASLFVAQHLAPTGRSILPEILAKAGPLPAFAPRDGDPVERGRIYVAPPDHHLLLRAGVVLVRRGPHENRTRPSANALFRSAALAYGARTIGVVLTGLLDDGTAGLIAIKAAGGTSIVQDPDDAEWSSMPKSALLRDHVDHSVPLDAIPPLLSTLVVEEAGPTIPLPEEFDSEDRIAAQELAVMSERRITSFCGLDVARGVGRCARGLERVLVEVGRVDLHALPEFLEAQVFGEQDRDRIGFLARSAADAAWYALKSSQPADSMRSVMRRLFDHPSILAPRRARVLNVIEYRSSFVGDTACCQPQRASPWRV